MSIKAHIQDIETRLSSIESSVSALCKRAEVNVSNWARWRKEETSPNMGTWSKVTAAIESMEKEHAENLLQKAS